MLLYLLCGHGMQFRAIVAVRYPSGRDLAYKIAPEFSVVTRMAWGEMDNTEKHIGLPFNTLERGFYESGIEANKIFKGLGLTAFFRYGPYQLPRFDDNLSIKISYFLDLGI